MDTQHHGRHTLDFEPPDLCHFTARGDVTPADMRVFAAYASAHQPTLGLFILLDITEVGSVPGEPRKALTEAARSILHRAVAICGASLTTRIVAKMAFIALHLVSAGPEFPTVFFDTETDARRWLEEQRSAPSSGS